jgi:hypothetical protein
MDNTNIENDDYSEPDILSEDKNLDIFLGIAFLAVWILSLFILIYQIRGD